MNPIVRWLRILPLLLGVLLASCTSFGATPTPIPLPTATPALPTAVPPGTAQPLPPTATLLPTAGPTATPMPPTVTPGPDALVGPEWTVLSRGDFDRNGREDVVAYRPSPIRPNANPRPGRPDYLIAAAELVLVERGSNGGPVIRLVMNDSGIRSDGQLLQDVRGAIPQYAALMIQAFSSERSFLVQSLNDQGTPSAAAWRVGWNDAAQSYRLVQTTPSPLVGSEWTILASGDLYGNGIETVVAYMPSSVPGGALPPEYVGFGLRAQQVIIVQRNPLGQPWVRVHVTSRAVFLNGNTTPLAPLGGPNDRTAALAIAFEHYGAPLRILPIDEQGRPAERGLGFAWNAATGAFDMHALGSTPDGGWPGPGWQLATEGDFNGDGRLERVYYRPSSVVPDPATRTPIYAAYTLVVDQLVIAGMRPGNPVPLATVDRSTVRSDRILATLVTPESTPANTPAAFLLAAPYNPNVLVAVIPINNAGQMYAQGFGLKWNTAEGAYRLSGGPIDGDFSGPYGTIRGQLGYPSSGVPPLDVYAINVDDPRLFYTIRTAIYQVDFEMRVAPGRYHVVAYPADAPPESELVGGYSEYVRCGERQECIDHTLIPVEVRAAATVEGVRVRDWYAPPGTFPARPTQYSPQPNP